VNLATGNGDSENVVNDHDNIDPSNLIYFWMDMFVEFFRTERRQGITSRNCVRP